MLALDAQRTYAVALVRHQRRARQRRGRHSLQRG
jgi:hypothetical protein